MSRVRRIYAEKRPGYDVAARQLCQELREALGTDAIARVRLFQRYDVEGLSDAAFESARGIIFSEPNADVLYDENLPQMDAHLLAVEYLPGKYDQRPDSAAQCFQLLSPDQATAKVVSDKSAPDVVGLYDRLEILSEGDDETEWIEIVTTLRQNVLEGRISKESPLGKAVLGHRVGDHVTVRVDDETSYDVEIRSLEKGTDDGSVPINRF